MKTIEFNDFEVAFLCDMLKSKKAELYKSTFTSTTCIDMLLDKLEDVDNKQRIFKNGIPQLDREVFERLSAVGNFENPVVKNLTKNIKMPNFARDCEE